MAITRLLNIKASSHGVGRHLFNSIKYIMKPEKTEGGLLIGGNSGNNCKEVYQVMQSTKRDWEKLDGRQGYHFILSWTQGETDMQTAYQMVKEFCEEYLGDNYDYVFSIHNDRAHMHGHIVFNSVNRNTGYKYRYEKGDWEKYIQPVTDKICERYGMKKLEYDRSDKKGKSYAEYWAEKEGKFYWKKIIRSDIDYMIACSESYEEFLKQMEMIGYHIKRGYSWKGRRDYVVFCAPGQTRGWKDTSLGEGYKIEDLKLRIQKETLQYDLPRPPRIKQCKMQPVLKNYPYLSRYQVRKVRVLYRTQTYFRNPYAVDQVQVRKNLLQIDRLREDCNYLIRRKIRSEAELEQRETELLKAEKILKEQQSNRYPIREEELYQKHLKLQQELAAIPDWDDRFEEVQDRLEELEARLPKNVDEVEMKFASAKEELAAVRQEKRIIRHIKKMDKEMTIIPMKPIVNTRDRPKAHTRIQQGRQEEKGAEIWQKK